MGHDQHPATRPSAAAQGPPLCPAVSLRSLRVGEAPAIRRPHKVLIYVAAVTRRHKSRSRQSPTQTRGKTTPMIVYDGRGVPAQSPDRDSGVFHLPGPLRAPPPRLSGCRRAKPALVYDNGCSGAGHHTGRERPGAGDERRPRVRADR
jgi:hypothetical protein